MKRNLYIKLFNGENLKKRIYDLFSDDDKVVESFLSDFNEQEYQFIDGKYVFKHSILHLRVVEE